LVACLLGVASVRSQFGSNGLSVGDSVSSGTITLDYDFPPSKIDLAKRIAGKNVIVLSLPGAFTPT
jgi:peroxiredoxin